MSTPPRTRNKRLALLLLLVLLAAGVFFALRHGAGARFDAHSLREQLRAVSVLHIALGCLCIYGGFVLRAVRWKLLMPRHAAVTSASLIAPQFIGFSAVALFGRLADLTRPCLIARRTEQPIAAQVAVYSLERTLDLAAAALLFSVTLAFAPRSVPHHEAFVRAGIVSLAATLALAAFAIAIRFSGEHIAKLAARLLEPLSPKFAAALAARILDFRSGITSLSGAPALLGSLALSLILWLGIAECYVQSAHAFTASPTLATLSFTQTMLLLATSLGGSLLQLPVLGWFTQIAVNATAIHAFYGVPAETATACAAVLLFTTSLSIIPGGLVAARSLGMTLREAATTAPAPQ